MDISLDKVGGNRLAGNDGSKTFLNIQNNYHLKDPSRFQYPRSIVTTWRQGNISCRLDRFYVTSFVLDNVNNCRLIPCSFSDHDYFTFDFMMLDSISVGPGYCKNNNSILEDRDFQVPFRNFWTGLYVNDTLSHSEWEDLKGKIKVFISRYCVKRVSVKRHVQFQLQRRYRDLLKAESRSPGGFTDQLTAVKKQLYNFIFDTAQGAIIRSRAKYLDNNEKPSKFFMQTEFKHAGDKVIHKLIDDQNVYTSQNDISNHCRNFYANLFTEEDIDDFYCDEFIDNLPSLGNVSVMCEGMITKEEVFAALKSMDSNKSPGLDGLSKEFYIAFWDLFGDILTNIYNSSFNLGHMCASQKHGCISLLCKDSKHPYLLKKLEFAMC